MVADDSLNLNSNENKTRSKCKIGFVGFLIEKLSAYRGVSAKGFYLLFYCIAL